MKNDILGELTFSKRLENCLEGKWNYNGKYIRFHLDPDDQDINITISLAEVFLPVLFSYDDMAKKQIADEMLDGFNNNWRDDDEDENEISREEFISRLELDGINFTGKAGIELFYDESNMFGGHSIIVSSSNGTNFDNLYVSMWG